MRLHYDQRVLAIVELRGAGRDIGQVREAFADKGWRVLSESRVSPLDGSERHDTVFIEVEVRLWGDERRAALAARRQIEALADRLAVELSPRVLDLLPSRGQHEPTWLVHESSPVPLRRVQRWAQRLGWYDTSRVVTGPSSPQAADSFARKVLPGWPEPERGSVVRARPPVLRNADTYGAASISDREARKIGVRGFLLSVPSVFCSPWAVGLGLTPLVLLPLAVAGVSIWAAAARLVLLEPAGERSRVRALLLPTLLLAPLVYGVAALHWGPGFMAGCLATLAACMWCGRGVYLLFRQLAGRQILATVSVALLPAALPGLAGWGAAVHVFYGAEFGIPPEDMDIAQVWRFLASAWVFVTALALTLAVGGVIGYVVHYRLVMVERVTMPVLVLTVFLAYLLAGMLLILDPPSQAGERAKADVAARQVPAPYFGIHAEPVCLVPVESVSKIPVVGGRLDPSRVYLSFGVVDGTAALWDPESKRDLRVPADKITLLPANLVAGQLPVDCGSTAGG
ncbi:hypothetical protein [Streptomyces sp. SAS_270]|uniref:hypothetical protein n=1 Tax=Streptomyces sp. SAS_270 TaxID=3412748 RepID=UPI00403D08B3